MDNATSTPGTLIEALPTGTVMVREVPETPEARATHVKALTDMVSADLRHWKYAFERMRKWRRFARGLQWPNMKKEDLADEDRPYVANITMRHLKQRTASIYAKNPSYTFRRSRRRHFKTWNGTAEQLAMAQQVVTQGMDTTGFFTKVVQEASEYQVASAMIDGVGETLTCAYEYFMREQTPPLKKMMKKQVLASLTDGCAYFKQDFQRVTDHSPDVARSLEDHRSMLSELERISADLADDELDENSAEMERMRALVQALEGQKDLILREGLAIDYPDATNIIPDRNMTYLPGFVGCGHVTEQYCLTVDQIKEIYGIDVSKSYTSYKPKENDPESEAKDTARVWQIWDKGAGLVWTICEGYPDYLIEPHEPAVYTERFWPWFVYAPNAVEDDEDPFPPSDVELMQPMNTAINRAGQSLEDHRYAARPGHVVGANIPDDDLKKIELRKAHDVVILKSLKPEEKIGDKMQAFPSAPIDPNLYNTGPAFADILRSVGTQEANLGGTSGSTATESSIAESSRQSTLESAIDEFDDLLTEMARAGGQILLLELDPQTVEEIVGPGAVWPEQTREDVAREIHLEVVAGSSGRLNRAQEVQVRERVYPLLFQIPGLSHEQMARDLLRVMDDGVRYEDWIDLNAMPIVAALGMQQAAANRGSMDQNGQPSQSGQSGGEQNQPGAPERSNEGPPRGSPAPTPPQRPGF